MSNSKELDNAASHLKFQKHLLQTITNFWFTAIFHFSGMLCHIVHGIQQGSITGRVFLIPTKTFIKLISTYFMQTKNSVVEGI